MKKIIICFFLMIMSVTSYAWTVHAFFIGVVSPGCFDVLIIITNDFGDGYGETVVSFGTATIGDCEKVEYDTDPQAPNDLGTTIRNNVEVQNQIDTWVRSQ